MLAVGSRMPTWVDQAFNEYQKRITGRVRLNLLEIPALPRGKNPDIFRIRQQEERKLLNSMPARGYLVALDKRGPIWTTEQVSANLQAWLDKHQPVAMAIGGPEGFSEHFLGMCDEVWSLSNLTFPHTLARVVVAEQIYRGYSILQGLPYHR